MDKLSMNFAEYVAQYASDQSRIAIVECYDDNIITYSQLNSRVNRFSRMLKEYYHIKKGDRVACLLDNCAEIIVMSLACSKLGAIFVPFNIRLMGDEIRDLYEKCTPGVILCEQENHKMVKEALGERTIIINKDTDEYEKRISEYSDNEIDDAGCWDDDFAIMYSTGTTGKPKGSLFDQKRVFKAAKGWKDYLNSGQNDRRLAVQKISYGGGFMFHVASCLAEGDTLYLEKDFDALRTLKIIEEKKITIMGGNPTIFSRMAALPEFDTTDISSLKAACVGGNVVPAQLVECYSKRGTNLINCFGMTETCGSLTIQYSIKDGEAVFGPMRGNKVLIADDDGNPVEPGGIGEILFGGPTLMKRYWNDEASTREAMFGDWIRTGDLGIVDSDGNFRIVGRKKNIINSGALKISPEEINKVISSNEKIQESVVFDLPHPDWGEAVVAAIVLKPGKSATAGEITDWCRKYLSSFKVPKAVFFEEYFEVNQSMKVDVKLLKNRYHDYFLEK